jgi:hypothetical protein
MPYNIPPPPQNPWLTSFVQLTNMLQEKRRWEENALQHTATTTESLADVIRAVDEHAAGKTSLGGRTA